MPLRLLASVRRLVRPVLPALVVLAVVSYLGIAFFLRTQAFMERQLRENLRTAVTIGALQFDGDALAHINTADDVEDPVFADVIGTLEQIRMAFPQALFVYLLRPTDDPDMMSFIADGDTFAPIEKLDTNGNGVVDEHEAPAFPGDAYDISAFPAMREGLLHPAVDTDVTQDQWGQFISGYAPIMDRNGATVALLGIDVDAGTFFQLSTSIFSPFVLMLVLAVGLLIAAYIALFLLHRRAEFRRRLDRERSAFVDLAMHQIGAPLATLSWWLELLQDRDAQPNEERQEAYKQLNGGLQRLQMLVQMLMRVSDVQRHTVTATSARCSMRAAVDGAVQTVRADLDRRRQRLRVTMDADATVAMECELLVGVLRELLQNAIDYSPAQSTIDVGMRQAGQRVIVTIADRGKGMTPAEIDDLFMPFRRGSDATVSKPVGNGVGLYIVRGILEAHGGTIRVQSDRKQGTSVQISLPGVAR